MAYLKRLSSTFAFPPILGNTKAVEHCLAFMLICMALTPHAAKLHQTGSPANLIDVLDILISILPTFMLS